MRLTVSSRRTAWLRWRERLNVAKGENFNKRIFADQPDGTWKERISGATTMDAKGQRNDASLKQARWVPYAGRQ